MVVILIMLCERRGPATEDRHLTPSSRREKRTSDDDDVVAAQNHAKIVDEVINSRKFGDLCSPALSTGIFSLTRALHIAALPGGYPTTEEQIKNGPRYFHAGYLHGKFTKENTKKRLAIVQRHNASQFFDNIEEADKWAEKALEAGRFKYLVCWDNISGTWEWSHDYGPKPRARKSDSAG
jgi:hypothetical protein